MSEKEKSSRGSFKGSIGFVLAAAGSAVGLGNIWRFPYLAAKDGGGLFLIVYITLALTFGFALLTTEVSIGRFTKQSPLTAYGKVKKGWGWIGRIAYIVPFLIMPYYCVIGGWVLKYFIAFATGNGAAAAEDGYFGNFITGHTAPNTPLKEASSFILEPVFYLYVFLLVCAIIIYMGVSGGIEKSSRIIMPILLVLVVGIAIFALTLKHENDAGQVTTGLQGMKVYLVPDFDGLTVRKFFNIVMDALGQLFYSLSVAMGIMVAYGSYVPDDANLVKSINQIEFFDTIVAFLAGVMIIPAVIVFSGKEGMAGGPSLMFVALPKVFMAMGKAGNIIGTLFFAMVLFAAVTSAMSVLEAIVSSMIDRFKMSRAMATVIESVIAMVLGVVVCLGYNLWYFDKKLPNGSHAQILDVMDYISNYILMPVVAIGTCLLIGWVVKPKFIMDEATKNGEKFGRKGLYIAMIKVVAPILLVVLLLMSLGII